MQGNDPSNICRALLSLLFSGAYFIAQKTSEAFFRTFQCPGYTAIYCAYTFFHHSTFPKWPAQIWHHRGSGREPGRLFPARSAIVGSKRCTPYICPFSPPWRKDDITLTLGVFLLLLQCDRQHPCGNCTLRSASHLCQYESKSNANNNSNSNNAASPMSSHDSNRSLKGESPDSPSELMLSAKDVPGGFGYIRSSAHTALNVLEKVWELQVCAGH